MNVIPLGKNVFFETVQEERKGLIITHEEATKNVVISVGKDVKEVKVGDQILIGRYSCIEVPSDENGKTCFIIAETEILAVKA